MGALEKRLSTIKGGNILDIACGSGWFSKLILNSIEDYDRLTGIEITDKHKEKFYEIVDKDNIYFEVANIYDYIDSGNKFDTVAMSYSMHHLEGIDSILKNIHKLINSNGTVILNEMYRDDLTEAQLTHRYFHELGAEIDRINGTYHAPVYSIKEIENLIKLANFQKYEIIFTKNDEDVDMDPKSHKDLIDHMRNKIKEIYDEDISKNILSKFNYVKKRLRNHGISSPPMMTIIGKF